jgi:hypothetical protein
MLIQLDFDGTVVEFDYPKIGLLNEGSIEVVKYKSDFFYTLIYSKFTFS